MKIQDILFIIIFAILIYKSNPRVATSVGLLSFVFSVPLFSAWVFFTAERLVWYGFAFILLAAIQSFKSKSL